MADGIDGGGADAAGGGKAGDQQRVDALGTESFRKAGAEKRAGIVFGDHRITGQRHEFSGEIAHRVAGDEAVERSDLFEEHPAFMAIGAVFNAGEQARHPGSAGGDVEAGGAGARGFDAGVQW